MALGQLGPFGGTAPSLFHGSLGLIITALGLLQPVSGLFRPSHGQPWRAQVLARSALYCLQLSVVLRTAFSECSLLHWPQWEYLHRSIGWLALGLAVPQMITGSSLFQDQAGKFYNGVREGESQVGRSNSTPLCTI